MKKLTLALLISCLLLPAVADRAAASCTGSNRLALANADCLNGGWSNASRITSRNTYWAQSNCWKSQYATDGDKPKVVAKVDIKSATDKTWHLTNSNRREGNSTYVQRIRGVYCCKDLSDVCNVSEIVTVAKCEEVFGPPSGCTQTSMSADNQKLKCTVTADCTNDNGDTITNTDFQFEALSQSNLVNNCDGWLRSSACVNIK